MFFPLFRVFYISLTKWVNSEGPSIPSPFKGVKVLG